MWIVAFGMTFWIERMIRLSVSNSFHQVCSHFPLDRGPHQRDSWLCGLNVLSFHQKGPWLGMVRGSLLIVFGCLNQAGSSIFCWNCTITEKITTELSSPNPFVCFAEASLLAWDKSLGIV